MLLFNPAAIGDTILTTPLISALRESFPDEKMTYVTSGSNKSLLENNPAITELKFADSSASAFSGIKDAPGNEKLVILRKHQLFYMEALLLGKNTYGFDKDSFFSRLGLGRSQGFRLVPFPTRSYAKHEAEYYLDLLPLFGVDKKFDARMKFYFPKEFAKKEPKEKYVVLCPTSGNKLAGKNNYRNWPIESYVSLANELSKKYKVLVCGKTDDAGVLAKFKQAPVTVLLNELSIVETAWVLKNSELVVTNDSGLLHVAAAVDCKRMIGIFGPTSPVRVMPAWKEGYQYVTPPGRDPHVDYYTSGKSAEYLKEFGWPSVEIVLLKTGEMGI